LIRSLFYFTESVMLVLVLVASACVSVFWPSTLSRAAESAQDWDFNEVAAELHHPMMAGRIFRWRQKVKRWVSAKVGILRVGVGRVGW